MKTPIAIADNPDFIKGFTRHLQREQEEYLKDGKEAEAEMNSRAIIMMQLVLEDMTGDTTGDACKYITPCTESFLGNVY